MSDDQYRYGSGRAVLPTKAKSMGLAGGHSFVKAGAAPYLKKEDGTVWKMKVKNRNFDGLDEIGSGKILGSGENTTFLDHKGNIHFLSAPLPPLLPDQEPIAVGYNDRIALVYTREWDLKLFRLTSSKEWNKGHTLFTGEDFLCRLTALKVSSEVFMMAGAKGIFLCKARTGSSRQLINLRFPGSAGLLDPVCLLTTRRGVLVQCPDGLYDFTFIDREDPYSLEAGDPVKWPIFSITPIGETFSLQKADAAGNAANAFGIFRPVENAVSEELEGFGTIPTPEGSLAYIYDWDDGNLQCRNIHGLEKITDQLAWQMELDRAKPPRDILSLGSGLVFILFEDQLVWVGQP